MILVMGGNAASWVGCFWARAVTCNVRWKVRELNIAVMGLVLTSYGEVDRAPRSCSASTLTFSGSYHWGQGVVYRTGTLQVHCKEMDNVPTIYLPSTLQVHSEFSRPISLQCPAQDMAGTLTVYPVM